MHTRTSVPETRSSPLTKPPTAQDVPHVQELEHGEDLSREITTLRERVRDLLADKDTDVRLAVRAMDTLIKAVLAQDRLSPRSNKDLFARYAATLDSYRRHLAEPPP